MIVCSPLLVLNGLFYVVCLYDAWGMVFDFRNLLALVA